MAKKTGPKSVLPAGSRELRYCDHVETDGELFFEAVTQQGVEGMMAKDSMSPYAAIFALAQGDSLFRAARGHSRIQEGKGGRQLLGSLVFGIQHEGELVHIGEVGSGFSQSMLDSMFEKLKPLVQQPCPFSKKPKIAGRIHWVQP